jgi:beta-xylosidase
MLVSGDLSGAHAAWFVRRARLAFLCLLLLLMSLGCGQQNQQAGSGSTPGASQTTPAVPPGDYENPVLKSDFPDPSILQVGTVYYAYATNAFGKNVQVARSSDLVHWDVLPDVMPVLPSWAQPGSSYVWAPAVLQIGNTYVMYYTARDQQSNKQCVGVATSDKPEGKFRDRSTHALVCQVDEGGTIDPSPLSDGGKLYLYFKNDGNCCGLTTYLYEQQLASDGLSVMGKPTRLVSNDKTWEGNVVEAPDMFKHNGKYYLFFSANNYAGVDYAVGYASCQTAAGPCQEAPENPILTSKVKQPPFVIGPGGESVFQVGNQTWVVYHAWDVNPDGSRGDSRFMWLDRITWQNDKPHVQGPTTDPEPIPTGA